MAGKSYNVGDRIEELGQDPMAAWQAAHAAGETDAPPPTPIGPGAPQLSPDELGGKAPDAPLPGAHMGVVSPLDKAFSEASSAEAKGAKPLVGKPQAAPAAAASTGTIGDVLGESPDLAPVHPLSAPPEPASSLSDVFHAESTIAQQDGSTAEDHRIANGYAPIVRMLGLPNSENPAEFANLDAAGQARFGNSGSPSQLATAARQGEQVPFGNTFLADRAMQESLIAAEIRKRQLAGDPRFKDLPNTVDGLHAMFLKQELQQKQTAEATIANSPGGIGGFAATAAGGMAGSFHDPVNIMGLAIPGGEGKTVLQVAARDALIQGVLELGQQPQVAYQQSQRGEQYTLGEGVENVAGAAAGGAVLGAAIHGAGAGLKASGVGKAYDATVSAIFNALPEAAQKKWASRMKVGDMPASEFFHSLNNHDLVEFANDAHQGKLTPEEKAGANVLQRSQDVGDSSPFQPGPAGDATHENNVELGIKNLHDRETPKVEEFPSGSSAEGPGAASPAAEPARPSAALSTAGGRSPQDLETAIASFKSKVYHAENNTGNVNAKNPRSSASGPAQFTDDTFRDYYRKVYGTDPGAHPAQDLKNNPEVQAHLLDRLTRDHAAALQGIGEPINDGNLYLMHVLGSGDGPRVLRAEPDTPIDRILSPKVLEENPEWQGKSASQVIAWAYKKMGGSAAHVPPMGPAGELTAASDDEQLVAQLNQEALELEQQTIGTQLPDGSWRSIDTRRVPASALNVDADRFQFKSGGDQYGVTDRLRNINQWDTGRAGMISAWEDNDGKLWVIDGHQRSGLARRIGDQTGTDIPLNVQVLREADGVTAEDARTWAALKNIGEGTGSAVDAAKVLRVSEGDLERVLAMLPAGPLVRDGAALARLSDPAFGAVYNEHIAPEIAAQIGHLLPNDPDKHEAMINLLLDADPANPSQARSIIRQAIAAGFHSEEQVDLFGSHTSVASLYGEKAKILEKGLARLRRKRLAHMSAAENAAELEQAGSTIARTQSEKEAKAYAEAIAIVDRLAYRAGPVADALTNAARELASGHVKLGGAADKFAGDVAGLDLRALEREAPGDAGDGASVDAERRGGESEDENASLFAEPGNQEQPTVVELEHAAKQFSDPDGPAARQQSDSLVHDLKAELEAKAEAEAERLPPGGEELNKVMADQRARGATAKTHEEKRAALEEMHAQATENQAELGKAAGELEKELGVKFVDPGVKRLDRALEKADEYDNIGDVKDLTRGGFVVHDPAQADQVAAALRKRFPDVADKGWKDLAGYYDRKLIVRFENGGVGEIQLIPEPLADYKFGDGHKLYEIVRDPNTSIEEYDRAIAEMRSHYHALLEGSAFEEAAGKARANAAGESSSPSTGANRAVVSDAAFHAPETNTNALFGESQAIGRSSKSKNLMASTSHPALDMGERLNAGKAEADRQRLELGAEAPQRAPGDVDQLGEIGLPLMDSADQHAMTFRIGDEGEEVTAADLLKDLEADDKAIKAMKDCL